MIEVRVFATLRQGRDKVTLLSPEGIACAGDILDRMNIPQEEVSILLINGFHHKPESEVKDGDIVALFPPVGGGSQICAQCPRPERSGMRAASAQTCSGGWLRRSGRASHRYACPHWHRLSAGGGR